MRKLFYDGPTRILRNVPSKTNESARTSSRLLSTTEHRQQSVQSSRPLRLAIVGSGPAGFYAAARVIQKLSDARIDMYEKLPVPFGLVRYGVAPDHPEVKNCQDRFEEVASSERFQFIGNASVGSDIQLSIMKRHYDALLFSYGASQDRLLNIPGEALRGVTSARAFVGWYNGLPEFAEMQPDLNGEHAIVIGNGNVALDVARVLLSDVDALRRTDMSDQALEALSRSRVKRVTIAGRRGPVQAAFTIKEIRELVTLPRTSFVAQNPELLPSTEWISKLPRLEQRKYRYAKLLAQGSPPNEDKACSLLSLVSPVKFISNDVDGHLSNVLFQCNRYLDPDASFHLAARVAPTEGSINVNASLAFRSIGYKASALPGLDVDLGIDFDGLRGVMQNDGLGRALSISNIASSSDVSVAEHVIPGCYCSGWIKTGPTGVIATTMEDAFTSADAIIADWQADRKFLNGTRSARPNETASGWDGVREEVSLEHPVSWAGWRSIDTFEKARGKSQGNRPRSKLTNIRQLLSVAGRPVPGNLEASAA